MLINFYLDLILKVLSSSVSSVFKLLKKDEFSETAKFCETFDRFFDCLNTRSFGEGKKKRKPDLEPYSDVKHPRVDVRTYCMYMYMPIIFVSNKFS